MFVCTCNQSEMIPYSSFTRNHNHIYQYPICQPLEVFHEMIVLSPTPIQRLLTRYETLLFKSSIKGMVDKIPRAQIRAYKEYLYKHFGCSESRFSDQSIEWFILQCILNNPICSYCYTINQETLVLCSCGIEWYCDNGICQHHHAEEHIKYCDNINGDWSSKQSIHAPCYYSKLLGAIVPNQQMSSSCKIEVI